VRIRGMVKKYLPFILLGVGLLVVAIAAFFVLRNRGDEEIPVEEEEVVAEIPFEKRPFASLTPTEDGHYLKLKIENVSIDAETLDYELLYQTETGLTQGVPGTFRVNGSDLEADLLLGSESSGKFRYDEGVEQGTLSLKFRNSKGKLVGKLLTDFRLYNDINELSSSDGEFKFMLTDYDEQFFVVMETFGLPASYGGEITAGPIGVFGSDDLATGTVEFGSGKVMTYDSSWVEALGEVSPGIFIVTH